VSGAHDTPMFHQFRALKAQNPETVLFFRMGDFYETFFEDAEITARIAEVSLTSRNKNDPNPIPMAGVPHHAVAGYIQRMIDAGYRVAIADQVEDPAVAKGLVRREVVRIVTPGVVLDPTTLEARVPNYLVAIDAVGDRHGVAFFDVSTGDLRATTVEGRQAALAEALRLDPREALLGPHVDDREALRAAVVRGGAVVSPLHEGAWDRGAARAAVSAVHGDLPERFQADPDDPALTALGAVLAYAQETSRAELRHVHAVELYDTGGFLVIDEATRRNLEISRTLIGGAKKGSLLHLLDRAVSPLGSRRLREWTSFPLLDVPSIHKRQRHVSAFVDDAALREGVRKALSGVADMERLATRISQGTGTPRDIAALRRSLSAVPDLIAPMLGTPSLAEALPRDTLADVLADIDRWLVDDPPIQTGDGGLIRPEADGKLARLVEIAAQGVETMARYEATERERSGIGSAKVRRNDAAGYYIEIPQSQRAKVPKHWVPRQQLTSVERYITDELLELQEEVLGASGKRVRLELELFDALRRRVGENAARIGALARKISAIDALCALAEVAVAWNWTRPVVDDSPTLEIRGGRHPVVEALLDGERFVPNDVRLDAEDRRLIVITGPNMAGKSTVLRMTAIITLLAQMGSFVPADSATVGVCDRIFTRVGAADDLAGGRSTFMVEMAETANILDHATRRSLVIVDEIGRGTSTYDGLAIAWAVAEDLANRVRSRALFATHYHELCELADQTPAVVNQSVAVSESGERIVFLRRLKDGGASRSYGIQCARIAGMRGPVIDRARALLQGFEKAALRNERRQLSLFGSASPGRGGGSTPVEPPARDQLREALTALRPDEMSPKEALDALYRLRALL
jgi:DNA mismatch repair protein MutS